MEVGDKVTVLPFDELDKIACVVEENTKDDNVCGIAKCLYDEFVGKEYTLIEIDDIDKDNIACTLTEIDFVFPIGCLKKL